MADPITLGTLAAVSTAVSAGGTLIGGAAAADAGARTKASYDYKAQQETQAAAEARAVGQRGAFEKRREGELVGSKLQARAAASGGGGASDPSNVALASDIAGRSEYDALFEMYKGENRARGLLDAADSDRMSGEAALAEGKAKRNAAFLQAAGTIIGGGTTAYRRFNGLPELRTGSGYYG